MIDLKTFLHVLFKYAEEQKINCCFARSYDDTLFTEDHSDIDIAVTKNAIPKIIKMVEAWPDLQLTGLVEQTNNTMLYIHGIKQSGSSFLCLDIHHRLAFQSVPYLNLSEIFLRQEPAACGIGYQPHPIDTALIYFFSHVLNHKNLTVKARHSITYALKQDRQSFLDTMVIYFGPDAEGLLDHLLDDQDKRAIRRFRSLFMTLSYRTRGMGIWINLLFEKAETLLQRMFNRGDIRIVIMGTDGSGKTTLIKSLSPQLKFVRQNIIHAHLLPVLPGQKELDSTKVNAAPHALPNRNWVISNLKLVYYFVLYWLDALLPRRGNRFIIYDRYISDILADPRRFRFGGSMKFAALIIKFLPKIHYYIWVSTPPSIAFGRKPEVPLTVMNQQFEFYKAHIETLPHKFIYTISNTPDELLDTMCRSLEKQWL
ncbi:MAG TPA: hypothetical protein VGF14_02410 [Alphaproteobacteria bacterium]